MNNTPIGAHGWLGNPFPVADETKRLFSIAAFLARVEKDPSFRAAVLPLRGKALG